MGERERLRERGIENGAERESGVKDTGREEGHGYNGKEAE